MKTYNFPDMVRGDDFHERSIKFTINEVDIDWANAANRATVHFRSGGPKSKLF